MSEDLPSTYCKFCGSGTIAHSVFCPRAGIKGPSGKIIAEATFCEKTGALLPGKLDPKCSNYDQARRYQGISGTEAELMSQCHDANCPTHGSKSLKK